MNDLILTRQEDIINTGRIRTQPIVIIGCGGIGSHLAIALARMGAANLTIIDPDLVSIENVNSQGFDMVDVGKSKVDAIKQKIIRATGTLVKTDKTYVNEAYVFPDGNEAIYVLAVDNMESRKVIAHKISNAMRLVINPAMGAEYLTIDTYKNTSAFFEDWLVKFDKAWFTDDEAKPERCTAKATIYTTLLISGFICKIIKDEVMAEPYVKHISFDIRKNAVGAVFNSLGDSLI